MILNKVNKPVITGSGAITVAPDLHHSTPEKQKAAGPTARARVAGLEFWAAAARSSGHVSNKKQAVTSKSGDIEPFINPYNGPDILINKALFYKFCSNQKSIVSCEKNEETLLTMHSFKASWRVFPEEVTPNLCWAVHRVERATDEFLGPWTSKQDKTGILATTIGIGQTPVDVSPTTTRLTSDEKKRTPKRLEMLRQLPPPNSRSTASKTRRIIHVWMRNCIHFFSYTLVKHKMAAMKPPV